MLAELNSNKARTCRATVLLLACLSVSGQNHVLDSVDDGSSVDSLIKKLEVCNAVDRKKAALTLASLGQKALRALDSLERVAKEEPDSDVRLDLVRAIATIGQSVTDNSIHGNNGQGKTNWLEAIHTLSRTKSFRTQRLQESIKFGEGTAVISGQVTSGDLHRELQVSLRDNTKSIWVNGKRETLARYLGQLQVFAFTADQLEVVRGMPEARRHFIDRGVASLRPAYVQTVSSYNKVIKQKNRILQDASERELRLEETADLLAPWNEQLERLGAEIHTARIDYTERINTALEHTLFEPAELQIRYASSLEGRGNLEAYEDLLRERLQLRLGAEIAAGRSLIGPHRDDLDIHLGGREIRVYGSSGQQRSALLLLDLAAISVYNSCHNDYPLFLVDDVDAELDEKRIRRLLEYLENRTQTFITTSKKSHVEGFLSKANVLEIVEGRALPGETMKSTFSLAAAGIE